MAKTIQIFLNLLADIQMTKRPKNSSNLEPARYYSDRIDELCMHVYKTVTYQFFSAGIGETLFVKHARYQADVI